MTAKRKTKPCKKWTPLELAVRAFFRNWLGPLSVHVSTSNAITIISGVGTIITTSYRNKCASRALVRELNKALRP